ncbi:MAG TPA: DUF502 domain-containing protein [Verrucomicrobiae bacterium]|nr:DUF502 domain-containing protein [Verrucomicrobiae bacterium]
MPADRPRPRGFARLRQWFFTGLILVLPMMITVWLLAVLVRLVEGVSSPVLLAVLRFAWPVFGHDPVVVAWVVPILGVILTFGLILAVGAFASNFVGRKVVEEFERLVLRLPVVKGIYGSARQLIDAFSSTNAAFRRVVAVEYPRPGVYTIGFLTRSDTQMAREGEPPLRDVSLVFLPTSPNPTSGWLAVVPNAQVVPLDMSIEEGVKLIVSGGLVTPGEPGRAATPPAGVTAPPVGAP